MKADFWSHVLVDLVRLRAEANLLQGRIEEKARAWRRCTQGLGDRVRFPIVCKVDGLHWAVEADGSAKQLTHVAVPEEPR